MRKFIYRSLLVFLSLLISFATLETAFRLYGRTMNIDFRLYSKELKNSERLPKDLFKEGGGYKPNANVLVTTSDFSVFYSINSQGYRDTEFSFVKPENSIRIGMFGDSFTFGEGVAYEKRFSDIIEKNIPNVEVLNFGYSGEGLDGTVSKIFSEGLNYDLDYVVLPLNKYILQRGGAEITDQLNFSSSSSAELNPVFEDTADTKYLSREDPFFDYNPNLFLRNSFLISYLEYKYTVATLHKQMAEFDEKEWGSYKECEQQVECDRALGIDLKIRTTALLDKLNEVCKERGCKVVTFNIDSRPLEYFYSENAPFPNYDLHEDLIEESKKHPLSFTYDHHYNEKTHQFLGQKMSEILQDLVHNQ